VKVGMNAKITNVACTRVTLFYAAEHQVTDTLIGRMKLERYEIVVEQEVARIVSIALDLYRRSVREIPGLTDQVNAGNQAPELLEEVVVVEIGRAPAMTRADRKSVRSGMVQGAIVEDEWRNDWKFSCTQFLVELMLLNDCRVAPSPGAVKLGHDRPLLFDTNLVNAVLVAVEREEAAITSKAQISDHVEDLLRLQVRVCGGCVVGGFRHEKMV